MNLQTYKLAMLSIWKYLQHFALGGCDRLGINKSIHFLVATMCFQAKKEEKKAKWSHNLALLTEGVQLFTRIIKRHMVKNADTNGM
jgi:hypothetical protein